MDEVVTAAPVPIGTFYKVCGPGARLPRRSRIGGRQAASAWMYPRGLAHVASPFGGLFHFPPQRRRQSGRTRTDNGFVVMHSDRHAQRSTWRLRPGLSALADPDHAQQHDPRRPAGMLSSARWRLPVVQSVAFKLLSPRPRGTWSRRMSDGSL